MDSTNIENLSSDDSQLPEKRKTQPGKKQNQKKKAKTVDSSKKGRSRVWDDFEKFTDDEGEKKARCKHCLKIFAADPSRNGTSALNRHLISCEKHPDKLKGQTNIFLKKNDDMGGPSGEVKAWKFCAKTSRKAVAEMIVLDELPFTTVEHEGFRKLMETICPNFKLPSRFTVSRDVGEIFLEEKGKLKSFFANNKSRVCLTTDTWTSVQRINYMCVTAHFIDDNWVLHKRIINFKPIFSHKGEEIGRVLVQCLKEWDIDNVLTVTTDNASSNDTAISFLKSRLKNQLSSGRFLHIRCMAHIINLIVQDGLSGKTYPIDRIRNAIRYIRISPKRLDLFKKCVKASNIESKALLCLDCPTRWNSTYEMIVRAEKFEKAFEEYDLEESNYRNDLGSDNVPTTLDWHYARLLAKALEKFKQKTIKASSSTNVVVNLFYKDIIEIDNHIREMKGCSDLVSKVTGSKMEVKFQKYWRHDSDINKLLYFAAILDPRQKLRVIKFGYTIICNSEKTEKDKQEEVDKKVDSIIKPISDAFQLLFEEYKLVYDTESSNTIPESEENVQIFSEGDCDFFAKFQSSGGFSSYNTKSELQKYLEDKEEGWYPNFDLLQWWKASSSRYPILSKMAKDIFAIPVSSVASESAFSTGGRVLDQYRSSLSAPVVEALICTQDWIRKSRKDINIMEDMVDFDDIGKEISEKMEPSYANNDME